MTDEANYFSEDCMSFSFFHNEAYFLCNLLTAAFSFSQYLEATTSLTNCSRLDLQWRRCRALPTCTLQVSCARAYRDGQNIQVTTSHFPLKVEREGRIQMHIVSLGALCRTEHCTFCCTTIINTRI